MLGCPNSFSTQACVRLRFDNFVLTKALARGKWIPACFDYSEGTELKSEGTFGRKVYADMVESILGLVYIEFGYGVSLEALTAPCLLQLLRRRNYDSTGQSNPQIAIVLSVS